MGEVSVSADDAERGRVLGDLAGSAGYFSFVRSEQALNSSISDVFALLLVPPRSTPLQHNIRPAMVAKMKEEFKDLDLTFSIGGQISFDVFPSGWDKTYSLRYLPDGDFDEVHFFGDKTHEGGNDYEIYKHER